MGSMLVLVVVANLIVFQYGRGAVRAAVDEGARQGARSGTPVATCTHHAQQALDDLLGAGRPGSMGAAVTVSCAEAAGNLVATARGTWPAWLPPVPAWSFTVTASAVEEPAP
ncbi:MAG TPA: hypothetical protein VFW71_10650 [Actinomycetota bacterium]|nr:hypothetical protein [Actinomycetota bacterium]